MRSEGEGIVRYSGKPETLAITPSAPSMTMGVTDSKENTNTLYAGERWGKTKKGPKAYLSERVFVDEERIYLGREKADGVHLQIGHVTGPQGPRSTLTYYDYVQQPTISFTLSSVEDCITADQWKRILVLMQRNGVGALRSLGHGQFRITAFDRA